MLIVMAIIAIAITSCTKESASVLNNGDTGPSKKPLDDTALNHNGQNPKGSQLYGSITGYILPYDAKVDFRIYNDKFLSRPRNTEEDGLFKVDSLTEGIYNLAINCKTNYRDTIISNIFVKGNRVTDVGTIQLIE